MANLNESTIEKNAIALFQKLGYTYAHGLDIGPDGDYPVRHDDGEFRIHTTDLAPSHLADLTQ